MLSSYVLLLGVPLVFVENFFSEFCMDFLTVPYMLHSSPITSLFRAEMFHYAPAPPAFLNSSSGAAHLITWFPLLAAAVSEKVSTQGQSDWSVKLCTHLPLVPGLIIHGALLSLNLYGMVLAWTQGRLRPLLHKILHCIPMLRSVQSFCYNVRYVLRFIGGGGVHGLRRSACAAWSSATGSQEVERKVVRPYDLLPLQQRPYIEPSKLSVYIPNISRILRNTTEPQRSRFVERLLLFGRYPVRISAVLVSRRMSS
jgi:hypothetical protein